MAAERESPPVPVTTLPSGAQRVAAADILRSEKGGRMIREMLDSRLYPEIVQGKKDRLSIEDSLVEEIEAEVERLRRSDPAAALNESTVKALEGSVKALEAILRHRHELLALIQESEALAESGSDS